MKPHQQSIILSIVVIITFLYYMGTKHYNFSRPLPEAEKATTNPQTAAWWELGNKLKTANPYELAIQLSKEGKPTIFAMGSKRHFTYEVSGITCDVGDFNKIVPLTYLSGDFEIHAPYNKDATVEFYKKMKNFNRAIISMPDFKYPHLCEIDLVWRAKLFAGDDKAMSRILAEFSREEFLEYLGMSEEEYRKQRTISEKENIYSASFFGHIDAIEKFIDDVNKQSELGGTALGNAVRGEQLEAFKYLLAHGADAGVLQGWRLEKDFEEALGAGNNSSASPSSTSPVSVFP